MAYDYDKMKSAYQELTKQQQQDWVNQNKDNAIVQRFAKEYAAEVWWNRTSTPSTYVNNQNVNTNTTTPTNSRNSQIGTWSMIQEPKVQETPKLQQPTQQSNNIGKARWNLTYEQQQERLNRTAWLKDALAQRGITSKTQPTTQTVQPTQSTQQRTSTVPTAKQAQWDYQDNSQARMNQIADNLNNYKQTMPRLFDDASAFYSFFIDWNNRSQEQIDFLWDYFNKAQKFWKYDNLSPDAIWTWIANGTIPEEYLNNLKSTDPQKYQEVMAAKQNREDTIKNESFLNDAATMAWIEWWESEPSSIQYAKRNQIWMDEDSNWIDDRREHYASEEEQGYQKQIADLNAANLDIDNTVKHTYEDLVKAYPWATKATLMAMAQDRNSDLLREKENNLVELTRLQGYVWYMQSERQEMNKAWADSISQLQKNLWMYYDYSPQWMAELAQAQYWATNITLDQADSGNETQKQMALQNVLDWYYDKYWDIIQRSEQQVINDVIAYAKKNWVWLAQALQENFVKYLQQKPEYQQMQAMLSEPNLQIIWYNSDWKAVYWNWDSITKTFKPVTVWDWGITSTTAWDGTSYTTNTQPLNNFITNLEAKYTIASKWWTWWWKIRGWWCWTVVNDYLWSLWDSLKLSEANDIKSYATSKTPVEWAIAYFDWTQSRATPETKKHGHVWIVVSDNGDTITVLESNEWTWLRYNDYKKSWVTGYYVPDWIKTTEYNTQWYNKAFVDAANVIKQNIDWLQNKKDFIDDIEKYLESWDYPTAFSMITWAWRANADSATKEKINAAETAIVDLISIKDAIEAYYAAWWNTWILQWTLEDVENALWMTSDPKLVWLATKISEAIQAYRKNISWTAFSEKEAKDYEKLFPSIKAWEEYNTAKIQEVLDSMIIRANWQYSNLIWPWIYMKLLDAHEKATGRKYSIYEEQSDLYRYLADNWYLTPSWAVKTADDFASWYQSQQTQRKGKRF